MKYKVGDLVSVNGKKSVFLGMECDNTFWFSFYDKDRLVWDSKMANLRFLEGPWREPLTAEFECEWDSHDTKGGGLVVAPNSPLPARFIGKKTHVTIREIL